MVADPGLKPIAKPETEPTATEELLPDHDPPGRLSLKVAERP
jgi:hypothetical protein